MKIIRKIILMMLTIAFIVPVYTIEASSYEEKKFNLLKDAASVESVSQCSVYLKDKKAATHIISNLGVEYYKEEDVYLVGFAYQCKETKKSEHLFLERYTLGISKYNAFDLEDETYDVSNAKEGIFFMDIDDDDFIIQKYLYFKIGVKGAKSNSLDKYALVKIKNPYYKEPITLSSKEVILDIGETYQLDATSPIGDQLSFSSSDEFYIADVGYKGSITAKGSGVCEILVRDQHGNRAICTVRVRDPYMPFLDVNTGKWYQQTIRDVYNLGLMTGATETLFKPNSKMNRAMIACVLHRMEGSPKTLYEPLFSDVKDNEYYSSPITWAKKVGVINGYEDKTFKPLKNVTREEMVTMIANFAKYKQKFNKKEYNIYKFDDGSQTSPYARESMQWALTMGIISGKSDIRLDPRGNATRAECAKMLLQAYKIIYK